MGHGCTILECLYWTYFAKSCFLFAVASCNFSASQCSSQITAEPFWFFVRFGENHSAIIWTFADPIMAVENHYVSITVHSITLHTMFYFNLSEREVVKESPCNHCFFQCWWFRQRLLEQSKSSWEFCSRRNFGIPNIIFDFLMCNGSLCCLLRFLGKLEGIQ